jgi:hypothetical protein
MSREKISKRAGYKCSYYFLIIARIKDIFVITLPAIWAWAKIIKVEIWFLILFMRLIFSQVFSLSIYFLVFCIPTFLWMSFSSFSSTVNVYFPCCSVKCRHFAPIDIICKSICIVLTQNKMFDVGKSVMFIFRWVKKLLKEILCAGYFCYIWWQIHELRENTIVCCIYGHFEHTVEQIWWSVGTNFEHIF